MGLSFYSLHHLLIISCFSLLSTLSQQTPLIPNALVIPVTKDTSSKRPQYTTLITAKTPSVPLKLTLDLSGRYVWFAGASISSSSTYRSVRCKNPTCNTRICNPITRSKANGKLGSDVVSLPSDLHVVTTKPKRLIFASTAISLLQEGLASGAAGVAGLTRKPTGLPSQLSTLFELPRRFSVCLPSSPEPDQGFIAFGGEPDSPRLTYTPLLQNPRRSLEYYIGVSSISIDGTAVPGLSPGLFSFNAKTGIGGTKISTTEPYTVLQTAIFSAVVKAFDSAVPANFPRVQAVSPFGACYATEGFAGLSPMVPTIALVLKNKGSVWSIFGPNSMVRIGDGLVCLGFIDGGSSPSTAMVIGGQLIEDNLLHFDLAGSKLGFTSSLLEKKSSCSGLNFTSNQFRF